ncbi:MAG: hypothetical protein ACAI44_37500 [Candidatus Sericytochromatia bacterium]
MTQTAEEQILAAARQSITEKAGRLAQLPQPGLEQAILEIRPQLEASADLQAFLMALPGAGDEIPPLLRQLSVSELQQLYECLGACYGRLFPPQEQGLALVPAQSLELLDFGQEGEDEEDFSLLDFESDAEAEARETLRQALWLLLQLVAAWYYVHHLAV